MSNTTLKQAYKTIDDVRQEVVLAEEASLEIICAKLQEENSKIKSPVIDRVIAILKDWGKVSANKIKQRAQEL